MPKGDNNLDLDFDDLTKDRFLFGSPNEVAEQIIVYEKRLGVTHMVLGMQGRHASVPNVGLNALICRASIPQVANA